MSNTIQPSFVSYNYNLKKLGSIEAYVQNVNAFALLSAEEELSLFDDFQLKSNLLAAEKLILSNLRYVVRIAQGYKGYGLAFADLVQEGSIGLMKAVKRFDPSVGVRLVSFAVHWIKSEIHNFVIKNWRIVKIATTKAQRKLFFNLRRHKERLGWFSNAQINQVALDLNVKAKDVLEMEARLNSQDCGFDLGEDTDSEDKNKTISPIHYLQSADLNPLEVLEAKETDSNKHKQLTQAFEYLDARSQDIVQKRWLEAEKTSLKTLAEKYKVSIERIRQIENVAMKKLKEYFF
jgi:RNA polymerase sigma-32 factor